MHLHTIPSPINNMYDTPTLFPRITTDSIQYNSTEFYVLLGCHFPFTTIFYILVSIIHNNSKYSFILKLPQ